jgi:predicted nucleotidyltransferase
MPTIQFPTEFSELLTLLNDHDVRYLVVGGYAVTYHGYPRTTGDLDLWIEQTETNADRVVDALRAFGFDVPTLESTLFLEKDRIVRMDRPPLRVEIFSSVSGVDFAPCYDERVIDELDGVEAAIIGLECLKKNKRASGRHKDLDDLEHLP